MNTQILPLHIPPIEKLGHRCAREIIGLLRLSPKLSQILLRQLNHCGYGWKGQNVQIRPKEFTDKPQHLDLIANPIMNRDNLGPWMNLEE